ncbi:hypothetical protein H310_13078 [Aphanomyces invadans]|uniref:Uncharacterized protein n=1 Tax=Aphanomyces invadans TaxID=157072 RepID=A0A024TF32_9STRA|nr:hypothetical protein H310_13078 [Aphanomyces invadans]ETV92624.1 hypothetical protein H310_13078 [Aphanomyces invadans]|eukprot:XP_008878660.1 hypothetical protein H310_13078 [Aphanomyces invadans]
MARPAPSGRTLAAHAPAAYGSENEACTVMFAKPMQPPVRHRPGSPWKRGVALLCGMALAGAAIAGTSGTTKMTPALARAQMFTHNALFGSDAMNATSVVAPPESTAEVDTPEPTTAVIAASTPVLSTEMAKIPPPLLTPADGHDGGAAAESTTTTTLPPTGTPPPLQDSTVEATTIIQTDPSTETPATIAAVVTAPNAEEGQTTQRPMPDTPATTTRLTTTVVEPNLNSPFPATEIPMTAPATPMTTAPTQVSTEPSTNAPTWTATSDIPAPPTEGASATPSPAITVAEPALEPTTEAPVLTQTTAQSLARLRRPLEMERPLLHLPQSRRTSRQPSQSLKRQLVPPRPYRPPPSQHLHQLNQPQVAL